jgi:hypothetical protein
MVIHVPKFLALDSSTLGKIARDHWSGRADKLAKAKSLIAQLLDANVYIVLSYTHVCELLRHDDVGVAKERVTWLGTLPMVAWIRPYSGHWWVGGMGDIALRELSAIVHNTAVDWTEIFNHVRPDLLETGVGSEMFVDRPEFWSMVRSHAQQNLDNQIYIASLARSDWAGAYSRKFKEFEPLGEVPPSNTQATNLQAMKMTHAIERDLIEHGDKRISASYAAMEFVSDLMKDLGEIESIGGNPYHAIMEHFGIPKEMVTPNTSIGEIGEMGIHAAHLKLLAAALKPQVPVSIRDVTPNSLPSFTVERELLRDQHGADRVDGSDLGDCHLVPLALYLDAVEVDKRTHDHVRKMRKRNTKIAEHLRHVFRCSDYGRITAELAKLGVI